jgi:6-pyruvoyltetrahydropterin/6-carboxytetrahydropterin synthase
MLLLKRRYHFAAAHRLNATALSPEENRHIFGQCNHEQGHGHNYEFEVYLEATGALLHQMMLDLVALDALVQRIILEEVDHVFLDKDVAFFQGVTTTAENIARVFFEVLQPQLAPEVALKAIRVYESRNNAALVQAPHTEMLPIGVYQH